jgi:hypothetical protein
MCDNPAAFIAASNKSTLGAADDTFMHTSAVKAAVSDSLTTNSQETTRAVALLVVGGSHGAVRLAWPPGGSENGELLGSLFPESKTETDGGTQQSPDRDRFGVALGHAAAVRTGRQ